MATIRESPRPILGLLFFMLLALPSCSRTAASAYVRPPVHEYPTRTVTLPRGLEVTFEKDSTLPVVGVSWAVRVGSVADPSEREGLAHLVEHLAFRAPDEKGFSNFEHLKRMGAAYVNGATTFE